MADPIMVRELVTAEFGVAARVLGRGMRDNPVHREVFGPDQTDRETALIAMFNGLLRADRSRRVYGALQGPRLLGVMVLARPGRCRFDPVQRLRVAGRLLPWGRQVLSRAARWQSVWAGADPDTAHVHLGPIAVDRDRQRGGLGSLLMAEHTAQLDRLQVDGYLETDKADNVTYYQRFGYRVTGEVSPFGSRNWLMTRPARSGDADGS